MRIETRMGRYLSVTLDLERESSPPLADTIEGMAKLRAHRFLTAACVFQPLCVSTLGWTLRESLGHYTIC